MIYANNVMKKNDILYLARWDVAGSRGVIKKIQGVVAAFSEVGRSAEARIISTSGLAGHFDFFCALLVAKCDVLIVRSTAYSMPLIFFALLFQRYVKHARVIVDVPTPFCAVYDEIKGKPGSYFSKTLKRVVILLSFPWALLPASRIVQYAPESRRFSLGLAKKTILMANGVNCSSIEPIRREVHFDGIHIELVCVANFEFWHGYDRLVRGLAAYLSNHSESADLRLKLRLIGDGGEIGSLRALVRELKLDEYVIFSGELAGEQLTEAYANANVGVSSLGLHRKGLTMASDLKTREYVSRGLPVVYCADDPDISDASRLFYRVESGEGIVEFNGVIRWYLDLCKDSNFSVATVREYALDKMDFKGKVLEMTKF